MTAMDRVREAIGFNMTEDELEWALCLYAARGMYEFTLKDFAHMYLHGDFSIDADLNAELDSVLATYEGYAEDGMTDEEYAWSELAAAFEEFGYERA